MKKSNEMHYALGYVPKKHYTTIELIIRVPLDFDFESDEQTHGHSAIETRLRQCLESIAYNRGKTLVHGGEALWDEFEEPGTMGDPDLVELLTGHKEEREDDKED